MVTTGVSALTTPLLGAQLRAEAGLRDEMSHGLKGDPAPVDGLLMPAQVGGAGSVRGHRVRGAREAKNRTSRPTMTD